MSEPYRPIDCSLYDHYEAWATLRTVVHLEHVSEDGTPHISEGRIVDLFLRGKEEWLRLDDDTEVRLDRIRSARGIPDASSR